MSAILDITMPIFILIGIGFFAVRSGMMPRAHMAALAAFVLYFALPALIFSSLASKPVADILQPVYLSAYGGGSILAFAAGFLFSRRIRKKDTVSSALDGFGMSMGNSGFIGYAVLAMLIGPSAGIFLAMNVIIENLIIIPMLLIGTALGSQNAGGVLPALRHIGKSLSRNPMVLALIAGLAFSLTGLKLPGAAAPVISMLASASAPVALFVIGGSLYGIRLGNCRNDLIQIGIGKLVLLPLLVAAGFALLPATDTMTVLAGIFMASTPMASIFAILAQPYGQEQRCSAVLMGVTLLSFFSMSTVLWFWQTFFPHIGAA